eukprot:403372531
MNDSSLLNIEKQLTPPGPKNRDRFNSSINKTCEKDRSRKSSDETLFDKLLNQINTQNQPIPNLKSENSAFKGIKEVRISEPNIKFQNNSEKIASPITFKRKSTNDNENQRIQALTRTNTSLDLKTNFSISQIQSRKFSIRTRVDKEQEEADNDKTYLFNVFESTILLTSRAIGVGFLYFPSHTDWRTFLTGIMLILLNFGQGLYSSVLILKMRCQLNDYTNFQELAYYAGGGRASIICVKLIASLILEIYCRFTGQALHEVTDSDESVNAGLVLLTSVILLYFCYNYKFDQFKLTAKMISITSFFILMFILASFKFLVQGLYNPDSTYECGKGLWKIYGKTDQILMMFPTMCFAFSFENSVMPLYSVSKIRDYNGKSSYKACLYCLLIALGYYFVLMSNSFGYGIYGETISSACEARLESVDILTIIMTGNKDDNTANALSIVLLLFILMQSILQLLYTFYESRINIHILFEELLYQDTSNFVEQTRRQPSGTSPQSNRLTTQVSGDNSKQKTLIAQTATTAFPDPTASVIGNSQKDQVRRLCFFILYSFNIFIACLPSRYLVEYISNLCGSTTIPMLVNVLPGILYFALCRQLDWKDKILSSHKYPSMIFAIFGGIQIAIFTSISFYIYVINTQLNLNLYKSTEELFFNTFGNINAPQNS